MIFVYNGENFHDFMKKLSSLLDEIHTNSARLTYDNTTLAFVAIIEKIVKIYKQKNFENVDFSELQFSKNFGNSRNTNSYVTGLANNLYEIDNPNPVLEAIIISFFSDLYELELSNLYEQLPKEILEFNTSVINNSYKFSHENLLEITRICLIIPNICMKKYATNNNMTKIQTIGKNNDEIAKSLEQAEQLKQEIQTLKTYLETQKHKYNFVGLSSGFKTIQESKQVELDTETRNYHILFGAILAVSVIKFGWLINNINEIDNMKLLGITIGVIMFLFILLYFFRITLLNIKSIKSQLLQIDLRLTLCQFIANYGTEIEKVNEKSRESFESVIFSPIVPTESQIPATFDGMEQLTGFIGSIKKE